MVGLGPRGRGNVVAGALAYAEHAAAAGAAPTGRHTMPTSVYLPHELSPLLYVIDDRVTRVVGRSTRRQSYRHPAVRRADWEIDQPLSVPWTTAARLASRLFTGRGWRARVVGARRVTGLYNTYDNGHTLLEFYWPRFRKWVLADTDIAHVFPAGHGRDGDDYLNMREVTARIAAGDGFVAQPLTTTPPRIDSSEAVAGDFCGYEQFVPGFGDDAERDAWYRGMFAAPYHADGSTQVFCAATDRIRRLLQRNEPGAEVLSPEAWAERFYPGEDR